MSAEYGVQLFAGVREAVGRASVTVCLDAGASAGDLVDRLGEAYPPIAAMKASLAVAVNREIAPRERVLEPGDEVALIPPVGGG